MVFFNIKPITAGEKRLLWISWLHADLILHKTSVIEVLEHLAKRGYNVTLFVARSRNRYTIKNSRINTVQVPIRLIPALSSLAFTLIVALVLPYYIVFKRPTYIVTDPNITILGFFAAPLLCHLGKVKLVMDIRSTPVEVSGIVNRFLAFFFNVSVLFGKEAFDGMTVITNPMKLDVCNKFNINSNFPGVWTSGVSRTLFDPTKYRQKSQELKRAFGIDNKFVIFYHGVFSSRRGLIECIRGIAVFNRSFGSNKSKVVLFLLGGGEALSAINQEVAENGLEDCVIVTKPVDYTDVPAYIAMCDVGISPLPNIPDWRYQSPLNVLEYLSMGKTVIATDIPAHRQIMGRSRCVFYASSAEPNDIARAITNAYNNRESLNKLGTLGRRIIKERYTWESVSENFDRYLSKLG
jgi:glycosyltransferase involved in cell wall biosynthesis